MNGTGPEFKDVKPPRREFKVGNRPAEAPNDNKHYYTFDDNGCHELCHKTGKMVGSPWCHFTCKHKNASSQKEKWVDCDFRC